MCFRHDKCAVVIIHVKSWKNYLNFSKFSFIHVKINMGLSFLGYKRPVLNNVVYTL